MNLFVDISSGTLVQGIGINSPANPIAIKSQDTLDVNIYLLLDGVVQDEGESPVLKFGLVAASDVTTMLVFESAFTRQVDPVDGVYYQALAVFNTTEMGTALAATSPLPCVLEIRFQLADGEIIHTLDQLVTIDRTILVEGGTPAATVIAVYPDPSVLEVKSNKDQHGGYAALDSSGHLTATDFDPSVVVLQSSRNLALGFAGLDAGGLLLPAEIPVDGTTTEIVAGKLTAISPTSNLTDAETTAGISLIQSALGVLNRIIAGTGITFDTTTTAGGIIINATSVAGVTALSDAETTTGQTLINATAGVLKRLVAGTNVAFDVTTTSGAIIINATAGGAGVAALTDAETTTGQTLIQSSSGSLKRLVAGAGILFDAISAPGAVIVSGNVADAETTAGASLLASAGLLKRIIAGTNITLDISTTTGGIIINAAGAALTDAETTTGLTLISSTAGVLKRLVAGTNVSFDIVTTPGAIIINDTGGGSTLSDAETSTGSTLLGSGSGQVKRLVGGSNITLDTSTTPGAIILNGTIGGSGVSALSDAETTAGVTLIATTGGAIKRLVAGTNIAFDTVTTGGAVIINDTLTGGALTPDLGVECFDDFLSGNTTTISYFALGWATAVASPGVVASQSVVGSTPTGKAIGVVDLQGGTGAGTSSSMLWLGGAGNATNNILVPRLGVFTCTWRIWIDALDSTSNYTIIRCGIFDTFGSNPTPQDGLYFTYNRLTSANWCACTMAASTETKTAGSVAVTAAAWHKLTITTDAAWANITFTVDGTSIVTPLTTNIPANTQNLVPFISAMKTLSTGNRTVSADYFYMKYAFAR